MGKVTYDLYKYTSWTADRFYRVTSTTPQQFYTFDKFLKVNFQNHTLALMSDCSPSCWVIMIDHDTSLRQVKKQVSSCNLGVPSKVDVKQTAIFLKLLYHTLHIINCISD